MDKDKKNSIKLLMPKDYIYLVSIFLMVIVFGFDDPLILTVGLAIFAIALFVGAIFVIRYIEKKNASK